MVSDCLCQEQIFVFFFVVACRLLLGFPKLNSSVEFDFRFSFCSRLLFVYFVCFSVRLSEWMNNTKSDSEWRMFTVINRRQLNEERKKKLFSCTWNKCSKRISYFIWEFENDEVNNNVINGNNTCSDRFSFEMKTSHVHLTDFFIFSLVFWVDVICEKCLSHTDCAACGSLCDVAWATDEWQRQQTTTTNTISLHLLTRANGERCVTWMLSNLNFCIACKMCTFSFSQSLLYIFAMKNEFQTCAYISFVSSLFFCHFVRFNSSCAPSSFVHLLNMKTDE